MAPTPDRPRESGDPEFDPNCDWFPPHAGMSETPKSDRPPGLPDGPSTSPDKTAGRPLSYQAIQKGSFTSRRASRRVRRMSRRAHSPTPSTSLRERARRCHSVTRNLSWSQRERCVARKVVMVMVLMAASVSRQLQMVERYARLGKKD